MNSQNDILSKNEGRIVAMVSYLTILGWILALLLNGNNKTKLGAFHIRQMLGLMIIAFGVFGFNILFAFIPFLGWMISFCMNVGLVILWLIGFIGAINREEKAVPVFGGIIQKIFKELGQ